VSLADADIVHDLDRAPGASAGASRAAAVAELVAAVQTRPGHVVVIAQDAKAAAGLFSEAEAQLATHRAVRVRGRELDGSAAVAALCADKEESGGLQALIEEARAAALPVVVVVAEADAAGADRLERLRQAVECVSDAAEVVRMVLLGGPRLLDTIRQPEARLLATRVAAVVRVPVETVTPERRAAGGLRAGLAGLYTHAVALVGVVVFATSMLAPKILRPRDHVAGASAPAVVAAAPSATRPPVPAANPPPAPAANPPPAPAANPPPAPAAAAPPRPAHGPALQVGAFLSAASAEALRRQLAPRFGEAYVSNIDRDGATYHRVRFGGFASEADLHAAETALREAGYAPVRARD
jgi:cell division septation protein DedD